MCAAPSRKNQRRNRLSRLVFEQAGLCAYCDKPFTEEDPANIDHIKPKSKGGTLRWSNIVASHKSCNQLKGHYGSVDEVLAHSVKLIEMAARLQQKGYFE